MNYRLCLCAAAAALAFTSIAPSVSAKPSAAPMVNPLATEDQTAIMARALKVIEMPEVKKAREIGEFRWKAALQQDPPAEAWASFDAMMDDWTVVQDTVRLGYSLALTVGTCSIIAICASAVGLRPLRKAVERANKLE